MSAYNIIIASQKRYTVTTSGRDYGSLVKCGMFKSRVEALGYVKLLWTDKLRLNEICTNYSKGLELPDPELFKKEQVLSTVGMVVAQFVKEQAAILW